MAQLSSGQTSGSEFLKVLGVKEELNILKVLMAKMEEMEELQTLAKYMVQSEFNRGEPLYLHVCVMYKCVLVYIHTYYMCMQPCIGAVHTSEPVQDNIIIGKHKLATNLSLFLSTQFKHYM